MIGQRYLAAANARGDEGAVPDIDGHVVFIVGNR